MPYWFIRPIAWVVFHLLYILFGGVRFEGREHVPKKGGILITPNHISDADPPTVAIALPRDCWVMAKEEIFSMKIIGPFSRWLHGFPVKRYTADRAALRRAEELLKQGEAVIIFPEGKLSPNGQIQPLLPGVLLIAKSADVSIVPTVVLGTDLIIPYGSTLPRRSGKRTIVRFGPPVTVAELTGGGKGSAAMHRGAERLRELMLAVQRGEPYPPMLPVASSDKPTEIRGQQTETEAAAQDTEPEGNEPQERERKNDGIDAQRIAHGTEPSADPGC
jgi:1-acyl-sn-glycerol-3-phosphate acyltransferase